MSSIAKNVLEAVAEVNDRFDRLEARMKVLEDQGKKGLGDLRSSMRDSPKMSTGLTTRTMP